MSDKVKVGDRYFSIRRGTYTKKERFFNKVSEIIKYELGSTVGLVDNFCVLSQILILGYLGVWFWRWEFWVIVALQGFRIGIAKQRQREDLRDEGYPVP